MRMELKKRQESAAVAISELVNANPVDLVLIDNTTTGINCVLRSIHRLSKATQKERPVVIYTSTAYHSVITAILALQETEGYEAIQVPVSYPLSDEEYVQKIEDTIHSVKERAILLVIDHIVSIPAMLVPVQPLVRLCQSYGVLVCVDGAHSIGQIPLDLKALEADFYITNCHKWLFSARGCAVLHVNEKWQDFVRPAIISGNFTHDFKDSFSWVGTIDHTAHFTAEPAINFRKELGGEAMIMDYTSRLAENGGLIVSALFGGTSVLYSPGLSMTNVQLPLDPMRINEDRMNQFHMHLLEKRNTYVAVFKHNSFYWIRISAQVYNDEKDFYKLAHVIKEELCFVID